jgi:acyl dehydratase
MLQEQYFEDYEPGAYRETSGRTITETDIVMHAGQTGDFYPHHMDAEWCKTQNPCSSATPCASKCQSKKNAMTRGGQSMASSWSCAR